MTINDRSTHNVILYNENGTPVFVGDNHGLLIAGTIEYAVSAGIIPNSVSGTSYGYVSTSSVTITVLRATAYIEPASASQMEIVSSSVQDDATPGGTGTRTIRITYYDGTMNGPFTEDLSMNGTSAVATIGTNIRFVESIESLTVGSNGTNAGTITLRLVGGGATVGTIAVGDGITNWAHHYVANGLRCFVKRVITGSNGNSGSSFLRSVNPLIANAFEKTITPNLRTITAQPSQIYDTENFTVIGPAKITMYVRANSNTACTWDGGFSYYEL